MILKKNRRICYFLHCLCFADLFHSYEAVVELILELYSVTTNRQICYLSQVNPALFSSCTRTLLECTEQECSFNGLHESIAEEQNTCCTTQKLHWSRKWTTFLEKSGKEISGVKVGTLS